MGYSRLSIFTIAFLIFTFSYLIHHPYASHVHNNNKMSELNEPILVHVGSLLDQNTPLGSMVHLCIKMAISDFYEDHPEYMTRLHLHAKSAETLSDANVAALELVKNEEVIAIFGPQTESANSFIAELGEKFDVPIISFTARSSRYNNYFIRTRPDDVLQARALAAMCKEFGWRDIVVLYEDMDQGNQFLLHLHMAFQEVEVGLASTIPFHASDSDLHLLNELGRLKVKKTRVFLVHMNPLLGYRFFTLAKGIDLIREESAWIISDSLSNFMNSIDSNTRNSMQGVVGLRPYVHISAKLEAFQERWKSTELNVYGLWAYDAATALAIAVENIEATKTANLKVQTFGEQLLHELSKTKFRGLAGNFTDGKLERSAFEIFNVYGSGEKNMGFWTPGIGLTRELPSTGRETPSKSLKGLKSAIWPGDSNTQPNGLSIPTNGKLRVGILLKKGFMDFVHVEYDSAGNIDPTGFAIDIFKATLLKMPTVDYEFRLYNGTNNSDWSYDDILHEIPKNFDMVVGATTIWAPRAEYVHFSLPYSESGAIMVVRNKKPVGMWTFIKPLSGDLWLAIVVVFVIIFLVIWKMEPSGQSFLSSVAAPFLAFIFADRSMVKNNWSLVVLLFGLFMSYILKQIYNAKLSAILANDQLEFAYSEKYSVGYQEGSFMKQFLIEHLHISEARLRSCSSPEEYHAAMTLGSKNGGVDVIFDEIPYMRILLKKYGSEYKMVLPIYRTGGFGFAFPIGSPLVTYFSKAILDVTQGPEMTEIENKNFGAGYTSLYPLSSTNSQGMSSIILSEFSGLLIISACVAFLALFFSETKFVKSIIQNLKEYIGETDAIDTTPVQQSDAGPQGQGDHGTNTSGEAPIHSDDNTNDTSPSGEKNDPQGVLEIDG